MTASAKTEVVGVNGVALQRLDGLQFGRAVAACSVVVSHAVGHYYGTTFGVWTMLSGYGVTLFFVISGYIMVLTTGRGRFSPTAFMSRRVRRIVPIYYVANFVLAAVALLSPDALRRTVFDTMHFILSLLFVPAYDPHGSGYIWPFFRLGWTLNYEMFFYLSFAALFLLTALRRAIAITAWLGGLIVLGIFHPFVAAIPNFYTQIATIGFIFGTWLGVIALYRPFRLGGAPSLLMLAVSLGILIWLGSHYDLVRTDRMTQLCLSIACTLHIALFVSWVDGGRRAVPPALLYIGDASYSIYLFHMFAIGTVTAIERRLPTVLLFPAMAVAALAGISFGVLIYWLVESRLNRLLRYRRPLTAAQMAAAPDPMARSGDDERTKR